MDVPGRGGGALIRSPLRQTSIRTTHHSTSTFNDLDVLPEEGDVSRATLQAQYDIRKLEELMIEPIAPGALR